MSQELPLDDARAHPCWFCGTMLPDADWGPLEHCDPTPPRCNVHVEVEEGCQRTESA